jgi:hypothetical protein
MAGIEVAEPKPFQIPTYDFLVVRKIASSTNLDTFYNHLLEGAFDIPTNDFTYGLPPQTVKKLHDRLINGFDWDEWIQKIQAMGEHYTVLASMFHHRPAD